MSSKSSVGRATRLSPYCVSIAVSLALSAAAVRAEAQTEPKQLSKIAVTEDAESAVKVDEVSSPKFTQPLLDTPQTIAIISSELMRQQQQTTLSDALRNTPGVTLLLGENGNTATGDSIFMRGFDTQGSIFVDGIRDIGTISRDTFNTEQVEIAKGPAGPDNGRSAASGYINMATKVPIAEDFSRGTLSYGTGELGRVTGDINHAFDGAGAAFRLNVMGQDGGIDGRDHVERRAWAIAPSLALGLGGDTRGYIYGLYTQQDNRPDGGVPTLGRDGFFNTNVPAGAPRADREHFYGSLSDFEDIEATMVTARIEHDFSDDVQLRNTSRYGNTEQFYILTGVSPYNATNFVNPADPASWTINRSRQVKQQENTLLTNQTNLTATLAMGGIEHSLTAGLEYIDETQKSPTFVTGAAGTMLPANLYYPNPRDPITNKTLARSGRTEGSTATIGVYVFDTITVAERWEFTAGLRADDYDTEFKTFAATGVTALKGSDTLFSYKVGALFKPAPNGSVYVSHAISQLPPGGANFTLSTATTGNAAVNNPNVDPQEASNLELGTKWDLFGGDLALTGAVFRSENKNDLVQNDPTNPAAVQQLGKKRVEGIELGVVGNLTSAWQISAGVAKMDTEVLEGTATQTGEQISWSPELTFTSWTTYAFPFGLTIGGGIRYVDTVARSINNTVVQGVGTANLVGAPDYWIIDAMVGYDINSYLSVQLNGYNLADEDYIASINNSGARYTPGVPRSALLSVSVNF